MDESRSQLWPVAMMCIAAYAHSWLETEQTEASAEDIELRRRDRRRWALQLRIINEFWLARQPTPLAPMLQRIANVLVGEHLDDGPTLRDFLTAYLRDRQLPDDAAPRLMLQHRMQDTGHRTSLPRLAFACNVMFT